MPDRFMPDGRQAVYSSYEEAVEVAERTRRAETSGKLVTKVERSPYGGGFIVRSFPASFLVRPRLGRRRLLEYPSL